MLVCSYISKTNIFNCDNDFYKKWGSLFCEFKNTRGFFSSQFYTVYFLRRLGFLLSQVYLNTHSYIQGILNIFGSFALTIFLIYFRPYKETSMLFSAIVGEVCTTLAMGLCFSFLFEPSVHASAIIEEVTIFIIIGGMICQIIASLYALVKSLLLIWKKIEKYRALKFLKRIDAVKTDNPILGESALKINN